MAPRRGGHPLAAEGRLALEVVTAPVRVFCEADESVVGAADVEAYVELFGDCEVQNLPRAGHLAVARERDHIPPSDLLGPGGPRWSGAFPAARLTRPGTA